jgi:hypothetical protein
MDHMIKADNPKEVVIAVNLEKEVSMDRVDNP